MSAISRPAPSATAGSRTAASGTAGSRTAISGPATSATAGSRTAISGPVISRNAIYNGDRQLRRAAARFGEEFRLIRLRTGVSQAAVARAIGVDRAAVCRLEAGDPTVSARIRARAAAVLGADFRLGIYADGAPLINDAAHARLVEALLRLRHANWRARVEAPVPGPGRRSTDLRLDRGTDTVLFEVETHVRALEAIIREGENKRSAVAMGALANGGALANATTATGATDPVEPTNPAADAGPGHRVHVVLVLPPTRHHRSLVAAHPGTIRAAFPASTADLRRALTSAGAPWPGDGILWLGVGIRPTERAATRPGHRA